MLDLGLIYSGVRQIIADSIGTELSQTAGGNPAIVKARQDNTRLSYPFATMDILNIRDANSFITDTSVNNDGHIVYKTDKEVTVQVSIRATSQESYALASRVHKATVFPSVQDGLYASAEATIAEVSDVQAFPDILSDRIQEFNSFNITLRVPDVDADTSSVIIENTDLDGTVTTSDGSVIVTNILTP